MPTQERSKDWMLAYNNSSPEDELQIQVVSLLAQSIHSSQEQIYIERSGKLVGLFNSATDLSIKKLNTRMHTKSDAFWRLIHLELSPSLEKKLKDIVTRRMAIGDRLTDTDKKGIVKATPKPLQISPRKMFPVSPKVKDPVPSPPIIDVEDTKSFYEGELYGDIVRAFYGDQATGALASIGLPSGLPQSLLAHYMFGKGREKVLTISEMGECEPQFNLSLCQAFSDISGEVAKGKIGNLNCIILGNKAMKRGTLNEFKIYFEGIVQYKGDQLVFEGGMTFHDKYDFDRHVGKTGRSIGGSFATGYGSTIKGKSFIITSEVAPIREIHDRGKIQQFWEGATQQKRLKEAEEKRRLSDSVKATEFDHQHFDTGVIKRPDGKSILK
jgi:hypothetical protein